jgi:hypothetical protein
MNTLLSTLCSVVFFLITSATLLVVGFSWYAAIHFNYYLPLDVMLVIAWYSVYRLNSWQPIEDAPPEMIAERF